MNELVPVHAFVADNNVGATKSTYVFVVNCVPVEGVIVEVGKLVLNVLVPVHAFVAVFKLLIVVVSAVSTYVFVVNCVSVVGVTVDVGRKLLRSKFLSFV